MQKVMGPVSESRSCNDRMGLVSSTRTSKPLSPERKKAFLETYNRLNSDAKLVSKCPQWLKLIAKLFVRK